MFGRRIIPCFILLTLLVMILAVSAKLRATPKFDRIQAGMTLRELRELLVDDHVTEFRTVFGTEWGTYEGWITLSMENGRVIGKDIQRRGPLERIAWLNGRRPYLPEDDSFPAAGSDERKRLRVNE